MFKHKPKHKVVLSTSVLILIILSFVGGVFAANFPSPQGFVNDFANVLDQKNKAEIQLIADKLQKEQGIELAVVTIASTAPFDPKEYVTGLFNEWGVGGPEDSGLVILLSLAEVAIEVETGYGLEGALPDGLVGAVIDQEGIPYFKNKNYSQGLSNMARAYANILVGEQFEIKKEKTGGNGWFLSFIIFMLIVVSLRRNRKYPPGGRGGVSGGGGTRHRPVVVVTPPPRMPRGGGGFGGGGSRPSGGSFGGGKSGGGGAGRRF